MATSTDHQDYVTKVEFREFRAEFNGFRVEVNERFDRLEARVDGLEAMVGTLQKTTNEILDILKNGKGE